MVKFYIVDDEDVIREGLHFYFNWENYGAEVVGSQINGERAMAEILELNPDVVITDVVMPKMDGIQLANQLRLAGYRGEIVFLSAYQEMAYVKAAFKFDAIDFIFKPIELDEFAAVISKVVKVVNDKKEKQRIIKEAQEAVQELKKIQIEKQWINLLYNKEERDNPHVTDSEFLNIIKDYNGFCVLVIHSYIFPVDLIMKQLKSLQTIFPENVSFLFSTVEGPNMICEVIGLKNADEDDFTNRLEKLNQLLFEYFSPYGNSIVFKLGKMVNSLKDINISLKNAKELLSTHFAPKVCTPLTNDFRGNIFQEEFRINYAEKLEEAIFAKDQSKIEAIVISFLKAMLELGIDKLNMIKANCILLCFTLCDNLHLTKEDKIFKNFISDISSILDCICVDDISFCLVNSLIKLKESLFMQCLETKFIKKVKAIIDENLGTVDIDFIARKMNISKNHLALKFKKHTGKTINSYITYKRMERAKQLLKEGELYIYEIASQVGYKDVAYFSRLFKKFVGCLPTEFKERSDIL